MGGKARTRRGAGRFTVLLGLVAMCLQGAWAQLPHYPSAWMDNGATAGEAAAAANRGWSGVTVYGSNARIERVDAFYRQFLMPLPGAGGWGGPRYCLDRVLRPEDCRRVVEIQESGGGTRIRNIEMR